MVLFSNVTKKYDNSESPVIRDFSEKIEDGEFIALTGKSGVGKTTLIRLLLKETEPDEGKIIVDVSGDEKKNLTVEDLLMLFTKASGKEFANDRAILS